MSDPHYELHRLGMKLKFVYSLVGLLVGVTCIIVGLVLGLYGVAGHTSWTASALGFQTNLNDAAPGVVVFIVGIFIVLITRFKVSATRTRETRGIRDSDLIGYGTKPESDADNVKYSIPRKEDGPAGPRYSASMPKENPYSSERMNVYYNHPPKEKERSTYKGNTKDTTRYGD